VVPGCRRRARTTCALFDDATQCRLCLVCGVISFSTARTAHFGLGLLRVRVELALLLGLRSRARTTDRRLSWTAT